MQNRWRRCWRSLCEMEEWKLTVLLYLCGLSLWGLCMLVLPCTPTLVAILGLGTFMTWWPDIKAKVKVGVRPGVAPNAPWAGASPGQSPSPGFLGGSGEQRPLPTQAGPCSAATEPPPLGHRARGQGRSCP